MRPQTLRYTLFPYTTLFRSYYDDASYVSIGLFHKQVSNFIVNEFIEAEVFGLRDPLQGPRAQQARAELEADGIQITDTNIFNRMNEIAGTSGPIAQNGSDPLASFQISTPRNLEDAKLQGVEAA